MCNCLVNPSVGNSTVITIIGTYINIHCFDIWITLAIYGITYKCYTFIAALHHRNCPSIPGVWSHAVQDGRGG